MAEAYPSSSSSSSSTTTKVLYSNIRGLKKNRKKLSELANEENCDILMCSETIVKGSSTKPIIHANYQVKGYQKPILLPCATEKNPQSRGTAIFVKKGYHSPLDKVHVSELECDCHDVMAINAGRSDYVLGCYRNPVADDSIYTCLKNRMSDNPLATSFTFIGDFNAHHKDWSSKTDSHGLAAINFANTSRCQQLIRESTHTSGNCLDLVFTNNSNSTAIVCDRIGSSDHNSIIFTIGSAESQQQQQQQRHQEQQQLQLQQTPQLSPLNWNDIRNNFKLRVDWNSIHTSQNCVQSFVDTISDIVCESFSLSSNVSSPPPLPVAITTYTFPPVYIKQNASSSLQKRINSTKVQLQLSNLDDTYGIYALFLRNMADILSRHICRIFRQCLRKSCQVNTVSPIGKILYSIFEYIYHYDFCESFTSLSM